MTADDFRRIALSLPEAVESAHGGHPDFRVKNRVFASLGYPGPGWGMVKLTPDQQDWLIRAHPDTFSVAAGAWGQAGSTVVKLSSAPKAIVGEALAMAWQNRAPKGLARQS